MGLPLICPPPALCTDNGVMVAWAGIEKLKQNSSDEIEGQEPVPRWKFCIDLPRANAEFMKKFKDADIKQKKDKRSALYSGKSIVSPGRI